MEVEEQEMAAVQPRARQRRRTEPSTPSAPPRVCCEAGHEMELRRITVSRARDLTCDRCRKPLVPEPDSSAASGNLKSYSCCPCDYDMCEGCGKEVLSGPR